jgi:hypothetical protein
MTMKALIKNTPVIGAAAVALNRQLQFLKFNGSGSYWDKHYKSGGNSGEGSYNRLAEFKAEILNAFVAEQAIKSVIEHGCGDGNQLTLAAYPTYLGFDVSPTAVAWCREKFSGDTSKTFKLTSDYTGETAGLAMSLDVIYHLIEDQVFEAYMRRLFETSTGFVIIYSSNTSENPKNRPPHVFHRTFSDWITAHAPAWTLKQHIPNRYPLTPENREHTSFADFYIYQRG